LIAPRTRAVRRPARSMWIEAETKLKQIQIADF
jgi:hypothetical protein